MILILFLLQVFAADPSLASPAFVGKKLPSNHIRGFSTDGCSVAPDGFSFSNPNQILRCCVEHDAWYWVGGTEAERLHSDHLIRSCIEEKTGSATIASLYFYTIRLQGRPGRNTTYRWGYGWMQDRLYAPVSESSQAARQYFLDWIASLSEEELLQILDK